MNAGGNKKGTPLSQDAFQRMRFPKSPGEKHFGPQRALGATLSLRLPNVVLNGTQRIQPA
jgi:hypothetical protein